MEEEIRKHFRGVRILVTLALLAACLSFAFNYILFRDVNVPLHQLPQQELNVLQEKVDSVGRKVDYLLSSRLNTRLDIELQTALLSMTLAADNSKGAVRAQARKAMTETKVLLDMLRNINAGE